MFSVGARRGRLFLRGAFRWMGAKSGSEEGSESSVGEELEPRLGGPEGARLGTGMSRPESEAEPIWPLQRWAVRPKFDFRDFQIYPRL